MNPELTLTDVSDDELRRHISKPLKKYCNADGIRFGARYGRSTINLTTEFTLMPAIRLAWLNDAYYAIMLDDESEHFATIYDQAEMKQFVRVLRGMYRLRPGHRRR